MTDIHLGTSAITAWRARPLGSDASSIPVFAVRRRSSPARRAQTEGQRPAARLHTVRVGPGTTAGHVAGRQRLFAVNTPDGYLHIFNLSGDSPLPSGSVFVGLEPVAVAARNDDEVWVVNHLSDSVSIVDVASSPPRVVRTLLVGDEPRDIVFAGPGANRAFITTARRGQNSPYPEGDFDVPSIGRADVWVFDANDLGNSMGGAPLTILTLFGDKPRALAPRRLDRLCGGVSLGKPNDDSRRRSRL